MRVCSVPGCATLYPTDQGSRCRQHVKEADRARGTATERGYGSSGHQRFRNAILNRDPICLLCGIREATVADHYPDSKRDLIEQGLDSNDPARGRGLCHQCHSIATATTPGQEGGWNRRE